MRQYKTVKIRNKPTFVERIKRFQKDFDPDKYPLSESLDDCYRMRARPAPFTAEGTTTSLVWLKGNDIQILADYLDEFEAWLKIQL